MRRELERLITEARRRRLIYSAEARPQGVLINCLGDHVLLSERKAIRLLEAMLLLDDTRRQEGHETAGEE